ncbi:MAG: tyrosine-type recombinase/integrase [Bryobacterales bacterium]|nr:tyrosine-type recombinase/integrase [Bryobacterales bacterium]
MPPGFSFGENRAFARAALRGLLAIRPKSSDRHLFLNAMGSGMTRRGFAKRLALHAQTAARRAPSIIGKTVSPHLLRHACALHTLEATGDVRKVSLWPGRSSLQTTERHLQADPTDKLDTLDKWRPPSLGKGMFKGLQDELLAMLAAT